MPTAYGKHSSVLSIICVIMMSLIVIAKTLWLGTGISEVGRTTPMMLFAGALVCFAASTWLLATGNRNIGIGLTCLGVILAFVAGQLGGVVAGPTHSRFEEQYRSHIFDYLFVFAALLQFSLLLKRDRTPVPSENA